MPLIAPNVMDTRSSYDAQVTQFLESFAFDRSVHLEGLVEHLSDRG